MKRYILAFLSLLMVIGLLLSAACAPAEAPVVPPPEPLPSEVPSEPPAPPPELEEPLPSFPLTVVDDLGRTIEIEKLPQRVISLSPGNTEILFALGLDDEIVGVTAYCNYPEAAKTKPRVGGYYPPDIEKIVSLEPDLVFADAIHEKAVLPALEDVGLTVVANAAESVDAVLHDITLMGQIMGKSRRASQLVADLTQRIEVITAKTGALISEQRPRVLYVCWHDPIWTQGSKTFIDDLIGKAGGMNIASDFEKSRIISLEAVVARNPQVIAVSGMGTTRGLIFSSIKNESRLRGTEAIVKGQVYEIDSDLIDRPGPRIVDALEQVAKFIHPEIFGMPD